MTGCVAETSAYLFEPVGGELELLRLIDAPELLELLKLFGLEFTGVLLQFVVQSSSLGVVRAAVGVADAWDELTNGL